MFAYFCNSVTEAKNFEPIIWNDKKSRKKQNPTEYHKNWTNRVSKIDEKIFSL